MIGPRWSICHATGGPNWYDNRNWLSDKPLNAWDEVITDELGRVVELFLHNNNLSGSIPPEIGGAALYRFRRPEPLRRQIQRWKRLCKPQPALCSM